MEIGYDRAMASKKQKDGRGGARPGSGRPALLEDRAPLDSNRNYMSVGFQWEFVRDWQFEFSFQENFSPFDNTTDVAFVFDLDVRF